MFDLAVLVRSLLEDQEVMADFQIPKKLVSDWDPSSLVNHQIQVDSVRKLNSDKLPDMKWWLHVKSSMEYEANYSWKIEELGTFDAEFLDGNVKNGEDQSIIDFDALSYIGSDNLSVDQPWNVSSTCMKNNNSRMRKIEAALNNDLHSSPKKKDQKEFGFSEGHFMNCDVSDFSVSEKTATCLMGSEKPGPWWRNVGKDELVSLVAQKSLEHVENCDLPHPQPKHFGQRFSKGVDRDKIKSSSINQKAETCCSNADGYTSGTPNSGCSFQDSTSHFSSRQSKDSGSSNKDCEINSENSSITELLEALCHSQTRAREAEEAAQQAYNEKEHIVSLFFKQASQLFAYKQWFYMVQLENLCLQLRNKNQPLLNLFPQRGKHFKKNRGRAEKKKISNRKCGIRKCVFAIAMGLSLVSAGLLLGWTMGWMFPSM